MKTVQGKEFNYDDVLLINSTDYNIEMLMNDVENLNERYEKVKFTKRRQKYVPIAIVFNNNENLLNVLKNMKKISGYEKTFDGKVIVSYEDGTTLTLDSSEESIVKKNIEAQRVFAENSKEEPIIPVGNWFGDEEDAKEEGTIIAQREATEEEKGKRKSSGFKVALLALLAALALVAVSKVGFDLGRNARTSLPADEANYIAGVYPTSMEGLSNEERDAKAKEILANIDALVATNLDPNTKESNMLDFGAYIETAEEQAMVREAMKAARALVVAKSGSEKEFNESVERYLNCEIDTINNIEFIAMPAGTRYLITTIFCQANESLPKDAFVTRTSSETDRREYDYYYQYFFNTYEREAYLPEKYKDEIIYAYVDKDCNRVVYTEEQMLAMAGKLPVAEQIQLGIMADADIEELGVKPEVELRREEARKEFLSLKDTHVLTK